MFTTKCDSQSQRKHTQDTHKTHTSMNVSATLNVFRLATNPQLCLPHLTVSSFDKLPVPLEFPHQKNSAENSAADSTADIRAIVLDKDNCFAKAHDDKVWPAYTDTWTRLRETYPDAKLLIVSNSAGTNDDVGHEQAQILEQRTGVPVLRHSTKKPGCHGEIMDYFLKNSIVEGPQQVAVVGDRLFTDMLMANMMGSWGVWVKDGVTRSESLICRIERALHTRLTAGTSPLLPPIPAYHKK